MELAIFLILFPLIPAVLLLFTKNDFLLKWIVIISTAVIAAASVWFAFGHMHAGGEYLNFAAAWANNLIILGDVVIALVFLYVCRRLPLKRYWIPLMVVLQYGMVLLYDFVGKIPETTQYLYRIFVPN